MKRIICVVLSLLINTAAVSCNNKQTDTEENTQEVSAPVTESETDAVTTSEIITAPQEDSALSCWFDFSYEKTNLESPADTGIRSGHIYLAKNETEATQLVISSSDAKKGIFAEVGEFVNSSGDRLNAEILKEYYIKCKDTYYPDPIYTLTEPFDLEAGKSQSLLIKLTTNANTPHGDYESIVSLKCGEDTVKQLRVFAHVWNFTLPEATSCTTAVDISSGYVYNAHPNADKAELYKNYYDFLLSNRVCAYSLPYDILDERADAYMSNPRVTSFRVPYSDNDDTVKAYYEKLSKNDEWMKKAYFYPVDEPGNMETLNKLKSCCERLEILFPGFHICTPFFQNIGMGNGTDEIDFLSEYVDILCPKSFCYTTREQLTEVKGTKSIYSLPEFRQKAPFADRMAAEQAKGEQLWWYVCWEPGNPYLNMYVDMTGLQNRLLFWQQKQYDVDGFLYWSCTYWKYVKDPWEDMATVQGWLSDTVFGDGSLLYPGSKFGVDTACGSVRLEAIRDGIEDYEYLSMAENLLGKEAVNAIIKKVSASIVEYTNDNTTFSNARLELGRAIEEATNK